MHQPLPKPTGRPLNDDNDDDGEDGGQDDDDVGGKETIGEI